MDSTELLGRARLSYEMGRLRVALPGVALAAALVIYAWSRPHPTSALLLLHALGHRCAHFIQSLFD